MQNTTAPTISTLESIDFQLLGFVSGGCGGGKHRCCMQQQCAPVQQMQVVQLPAAPAAAPAPLPAAPDPQLSSGPTVSTSVSINGQPA
jgi:hypothetical protein